MKINTKNNSVHLTHEGGQARRITVEQQLERSVMSCMLFENENYENGQEISDRILDLAAACKTKFVADLAVKCRTKFNIRHAPLLLLTSLIKRGGKEVGDAIYNTIGRADEMAELIAMYWKYNPDKGLTKQMKLGISRAFGEFNQYQLAKYDRKDAQVKLRDVLFLTHPNPNKEKWNVKEREELYKLIANNQLPPPNTWESRLTAGENKKDVFTDLLSTKKLGYMALLRNLRGMNEAGVDHSLIKDSILNGERQNVLPYRFIAAARHAPMFERELDAAMVKSMAFLDQLEGNNVVLVDVSGSMEDRLSGKSDLTRLDAGCGLAILLSGMCKNLRVFTFSNDLVEVPARQGMALADSINRSQRHASTKLKLALTELNSKVNYDRIIVITDEQSSDGIINPKGKGYVINVASARNGVGYGKWVHIDGFSEAVVNYIRQLEESNFAD